MSLGEIAEDFGISRQGVFDLIKRCDKTLQGYEEKLKLIQKFEQIKTTVEEIEQKTSQEDIKMLARRILAEL